MSQTGPSTAPGPSPQPAASPASKQAQQRAEQWWASAGPAFLAAFRTGQCTDWASQKRPDIIERVEIAHERASILEHPGLPNVNDWNAYHWAALAAWAGISTGHTPRVGAIIVFQPGVEFSGPGGFYVSHPVRGHVGYVEDVNSDGSFTISEMNGLLGPGRVDAQNLSAGVAATPGITFIYS